MSLRTTVITDFGPEAKIMPILRIRKEKWPKTAVNASRLPKYSSLTGNRGRWIQWLCHNYNWKLRNSCFFLRVRSKNMAKINWNVKSPKFSCVHKKSMSVRTTVITGFGPNAYIMRILRMRKGKWPKTAVSAFRLPKFPIAIGNRYRRIRQRCQNCSQKLGKTAVLYTYMKLTLIPATGRGWNDSPVGFLPKIA